jgi:hypothetical protein
MPGTGSAPLDILPLWALFLVLLFGNLLLAECGFRLGRLRSRRTQKESDTAVSAIVASELGLLAFMLAFSFGIAATRFDLRRTTLLNEANAIGTSYLRAAMLPSANGELVRDLLREYVDVRLQATQGGLPVTQALHRSEEIQQQLWAQAVAAAERDPHALPTELFVQSLNEVIDLHSMRVMASLRNRMPLPVWIVLFGVGLLSFLTMGYQAGLARATRSPATLVMAVTFVAVIWLVADLDRPGEGFLHVSQEPMIEVRQMMASTPPRN